MTQFHSPTAASLRLMGFLLWSVLFIPFYAAILGMGRVALCRHLARIYWRIVAFVIGIRIVVRGRPTPHSPALFISNHASYLDIVVLGALLDTAFVAKKEVGEWPGFGIIAKLGRTVFVDRKRRTSAHQRDEMSARLVKVEESLVLFPEGTSNDGNHVLPFKSALFSVAEAVAKQGRELPVQPVSIAYTKLDGMPIGHGWRAFYAWYGDMDLAPHLWTILGLGRVTVEVDFHPAVSLSGFSSRKSLSDHCYRVISKAVAAANCGRIEPAPETNMAGEVAAG